MPLKLARRKTSVLLFLAACHSMLACSSPEAKLEQHLRRADAYLETGELSSAIIEYKNVLQIDPNHAGAHHRLSQAYLRSERFAEGLWELQESIRLDPANLEARLQFGHLSIEAGAPEESLEQADAVIASDPTLLPGYLLKGLALEALRRPEDAHAVYRKAVEVAPESPTALRVLANFLQGRGDREAAEPLVRELAKISPTASSYVLLAEFLASDGRRDDEAEASYARALQAATPAERGRVSLAAARFLLSRGRVEQAVRRLEEGIERSEAPLDLIYLLARTYRSLGDRARSDALVEHATRVRSDDPRPFLVLSVYRELDGDLPGALEAARRAALLDPDDPHARLRQAEVSFELGSREGRTELVVESRGFVDDLLADDPSNSSALLVRAKMDLARGNIDAAIASLRAAIQLQPGSAVSHLLLGTALASTGRHAAARAELLRAVDLDPGLLEAHKSLAYLHSRLGAYEDSVEAGRQHLRAKPDSVETRLLVAQSLLRLRRSDEALRELESIPDADRNAQVLFALGETRTSLGQLDAARADLVRANQLAPTHPGILRGLLELDRRENKLDASLQRLQSAVAANPENAALVQLLGIVQRMAGRTREAEQSLLRAVELDPEDISSYEQLAQYYSATGRLDEAIQTYERALDARPEQGSLYQLLGFLYESLGQRERAIQRYEEAIDRDPTLAHAKNHLAYLFAEAGENLDRALSLALEAKALLPDNPHVADTLGWVLYKKGVPVAAIAYLREAEAGLERDDPALGAVRHHLALAYEASGDPQHARATLERGLADFEAHVAARAARGRALGAEPPWVGDARSMLDRLPPEPH